MRLLLSLSFLGVLSCSGRVEPRQPESCQITVQSTWPENGTMDAHYRQNVEFHLSSPITEATVLTDLPGTQWISDDGLMVGFQPDADFEPNTTYDFGLAYCGGEPQISFSTSSHGLTVMDTASLAGMTFLADLNSIRFQSAENVSEILLSIFDRSVMVQILDIDDETLSFRFAVAKNNTSVPEQDTCYRTLDQTEIDFTENPLFVHQADALQFDAFTAQLSLRDLRIEGSIAPDGLSLGGITFQVTLDVREVTDMMGVDNFNEVCALASNVGSDCVPCQHDGVEACIDVAGTGLEGSLTSGNLIEILTEQEHEDCDKSSEEE